VQAMTLDCAAIGCKNTRLDQEDIASSVAGKQTTAFCSSSHETSVTTAPPVPCLSK